MSSSDASVEQQRIHGKQRAPLVHTATIADTAAQQAEITIDIPVEGRASIELFMAVWSPGFYRVEEYASRVEELSAQTIDGRTLDVEQTQANRWKITTNGERSLRVRYLLRCADVSVTTNWIDAEYAVLNGPATFMNIVGDEGRQHEVILHFPATWSHALTALPTVAGSEAYHYRAADFDTLLDSPILIGNPELYHFTVAEREHTVAAVGQRRDWDGAAMSADLARVVAANFQFWGTLPYQRYLFLLMFRPGGGGLEHSDSTLVTAHPERMATPEGRPALLGLLSHEYVHAYNVKRLRPLELGPFDYEQPPRTINLWISEGMTCYYGDLLLCRAGLHSVDELIASLDARIAQLQQMPGRLIQTLEQSSYDVWTNSFSGINASDTTVSYYVKGHVVAFLLDIHIRRASNGIRSLDDVMRLALARFGGAQGFTPEQFRAVAQEATGIDLDAWIAHAIASTAELDYSEMLDWLGLSFAPSDDLRLIVRADATETQRERLRTWAEGS